MAKPKRTFTGQEGQRSTGTAGPDAIRRDFDAAFAMFDPNATLPDGDAGGIGAENMKPGAATDEVIGDRTINDSTTPSGDTGKLTTLLSNLANRIRAIMGTSSWRSGPPTTLQAAKDHIDAPAPHSGHETPAGAQAKVDAHANRRDNPHQVTAAQVGAITAVAGISNPGGNVDIVAGSAISITKDTTNKRIVINAHTEGAAPGPHASTHASGGSDPITPAMIGAAAASHSHSASDITSGVLSVARGGTGIGFYTAGNYLRAASATALEQRTPAQVLSDIGAAPASHTHSWDQITNKPTTFTPSSHTHAASDITSGTINAARLPKASTSAEGIVRLVNSYTSTSTSEAPTANALRLLHDLVASSSIVEHNLDVQNPPNGYYVRHADGRQECWVAIEVPVQKNTSVDGYWTYPAVFASVPNIVTGLHTDENTGAALVQDIGLVQQSKSQVRWAVRNNTNFDRTLTVHLRVVGRWQ